jgi:hypothetical protein
MGAGFNGGAVFGGMGNKKFDSDELYSRLKNASKPHGGREQHERFAALQNQL